MMKKIAIVLSAGKGKRMGADIAKQYMEVNGHVILWYTLEAFIKSKVDEIVLVISKEDEEYVKREVLSTLSGKKTISITYGGEERYHSVNNALLYMNADEDDIVLVHDGARPLITAEQIDFIISKVKKGTGCIAAVPAKDTIKVINDEGQVVKTPNRKKLWQVQTPQGFCYKSLKDAYELAVLARDNTITDDAMVVEKYGVDEIVVAKLDYDNIKITTPEDLLFMKAILNHRER